MSYQAVTLPWGNGLWTIFRLAGDIRLQVSWLGDSVGNHPLHARVVPHIHLSLLVRQQPWLSWRLLPPWYTFCNWLPGQHNLLYFFCWFFFFPRVGNVGKLQSVVLDPDFFFICTYFFRDRTQAQELNAISAKTCTFIFAAQFSFLNSRLTSKSLVICSLVGLEPSQTKTGIQISSTPQIFSTHGLPYLDQDLGTGWGGLDG